MFYKFIDAVQFEYMGLTVTTTKDRNNFFFTRKQKKEIVNYLGKRVEFFKFIN